MKSPSIGLNSSSRIYIYILCGMYLHLVFVTFTSTKIQTLSFETRLLKACKYM